MTNEHRKQIDALIAAGEKASHQLRTAARRIENIRDGRSDRVSCDCVNLALELEHIDARPALKALVARLELAEAPLELTLALRAHDAKYRAAVAADDPEIYAEWAAEQDALENKRADAIAAWRAAKEATDA